MMHDGLIEAFFRACHLKYLGKFRVDGDGGTRYESAIRYNSLDGMEFVKFLTIEVGAVGAGAMFGEIN
jgi:hypothetical protein